MESIRREIFQSFWKIHVLHHAAAGPVYGQWMLHELREHGYEVSPGTLFPMLARLEKRGWLRSERDPNGGARARRDYYLTEKGHEVLRTVLHQLRELVDEVADPSLEPPS